MVNIYVGNTDNDWFDFLASQPGIDEVNFWQPSSQNFRAIGEGERFAFRLKSPRDKIGGFGTLVEVSKLPIQIAWEAFGPKNGVQSLEALVSAIARYRTDETVTPSTFIVCRILVEPVFLPPYLWFDVPKSWSGSIMKGKTFGGETAEGQSLWVEMETAAAEADPGRVVIYEGERFGTPVLVHPRLGQGAFRVAITELYQRQCALTGGKVLPALDAAHIRPYSAGGQHVRPNGLLLRKDIHSVFDAGYATIDGDYRFVVSDKVRDVFNNGNEYRRLHGQRIWLPANPRLQPDRSALAWHNENKFLG